MVKVIHVHCFGRGRQTADFTGHEGIQRRRFAVGRNLRLGQRSAGPRRRSICPNAKTVSRRRSDSAASALEKLQLARQAIREARDFSGAYGSVDAEAIARMAKSHLTDVLDNQPTLGLSATDAADRYLDNARVQLAPIAAQSVEAAQAMDLLAAIYLSRADARTLPSSTALCLRRAALQGQPSNASLASRLGMHLADVGLMDEARWALEHSMSLEADPGNSRGAGQSPTPLWPR